MKNGIFLLVLFITSGFAQTTSESFIVTVKDASIHVVSPKKKSEIVSTTIINETFDSIVSELRSDKKVLKRFKLEPKGEKGSTQTFSVNYSEVKALFYVSVAPPFQAVDLKFAEKDYEIPSKE